MTIAVICPTIAGRKDEFARCYDSYRATLGREFHWLPVFNQPNCGRAWAEGAARALEQGADYLHFSADDIEAHDGWLYAALDATARNVAPCARVLNSDGSVQSCGDLWGVECDEGTLCGITRVPFIEATWWQFCEPMLDAHYYTDTWISHRLSQHNIPTVVVRDFLFTHHMSPIGRLETSEADRREYDRRVTEDTTTSDAFMRIFQ